MVPTKQHVCFLFFFLWVSRITCIWLSIENMFLDVNCSPVFFPIFFVTKRFQQSKIIVF